MNIRESYAEVLTERASELLGNRVPKSVLLEEARVCAGEMTFESFKIINDLTRCVDRVDIERLATGVLTETPTKTVTLNGAIFHNQTVTHNHLADALVYMGTKRSEHKSLLPTLEENSPDYIYHDLLQGVYKIIANSFYGILGSKRSFLFHPALGPSITYTGWHLITHMIQTFEDFTNNPRHRDIWELSQTIDLIVSSTRTLNRTELRTPSRDEVYAHLRDHCEVGFEDTFDLIRKRIELLSEDQLQRVYYAFNPLAFFRDTTEWRRVFTSFASPELNVFKLTDEMRAWYIPLATDLLNACFYPRVLASREERALDERYAYSVRKIVILSDTDSTFLNFGFWTSEIGALAEGADIAKLSARLVPFMIYLYQEIAKGGITLFCNAVNIPTDTQKLIAMKNEYWMSRVMLTPASKNYASYIIYREGVPVTKKNVDVKGLKFMKSVTAVSTSQKIRHELLLNLILKSQRIDVRTVLEWLEDFGESIEKTIQEGRLEYATPMQVSDNYKNPERMMQLRGANLWNELYPENPIPLPAKVHVVKTVKFHAADLDAMTHIDPAFRERLKVAIANSPALLKYGVTAISLPYGMTRIPEEWIQFVDVGLTVTSQLDNAKPLLRSLGLHLMNDVKPYSGQATLTINCTNYTGTTAP